MTDINESELELDVLAYIQNANKDIRQRDLARALVKSLGMTNAILKRLTYKGMLSIRKVNNRNISYAVTPMGVRELAKRSYRYVRNTIRNVVDFKEVIDGRIQQFVAGVTPTSNEPVRLILVGSSDVDFIFEHLSQKHGISFVRLSTLSDLTPEVLESETCLIVVSENLFLDTSVGLLGCYHNNKARALLLW